MEASGLWSAVTIDKYFSGLMIDLPRFNRCEMAERVRTLVVVDTVKVQQILPVVKATGKICHGRAVVIIACDVSV